MVHRIINDILKPWEELNDLLVRRLALEPGLSDVTREAANIAVALKHQVDHRGEKRNLVNAASPANSLMSDIADSAKHGPLWDSSRDATLSVASCFEYKSDEGFRFIRNAVTISHRGTGQHDFMTASLAAAEYWMNHVGFALDRRLAVEEGPSEFYPTAFLYYDPLHCITMGQTQLKFFERLNDGVYRPVDPPEVKFEVFETPSADQPTSLHERS